MENDLDIEIIEAYNEFKEKSGMKVEFEDFDKVFLLRDNCMADGFIPKFFGMTLVSRVVNNLGRWLDVMHHFVMPNPSSLVRLTEANMFDEEDKKNMQKVMTTIMTKLSRYTIIEVNKDDKEIAKFIDDIYDYWNNDLKETILKYSNQIIDGWQDELKKYDEDKK
jgi:hypothetical protein